MNRNIQYENLLLDYYGDLLTDHQKDILNDYIRNDFSMIEISENLNISKAAVSDLIKRSLKQLNDYENKLKLIKQKEDLESLFSKMIDNNIDSKYIEKIRKILER